MCQARTKALLCNLSSEFEQLQVENDALSRENSSLTEEVAKLQARLAQAEASIVAGDHAPSLGMMQQRLSFLKHRPMPMPPSSYDPQPEDIAPTSRPAELEIRVAEKEASLENDYANGESKQHISEGAALLSNANSFSRNVTDGSQPSDAQSNLPVRERSERSLPTIQEQSSKCSTKGTSDLKNDKSNSTVTPKEVFDLWPAWEEDAVMQTQLHMRLARSLVSEDDYQEDSAIRDLKFGAEIRTSGFLQYFVARPSSKRQIFWDILSVLFMFVDLMMVPMQAFPMPQTEFTRTLDWATVIFWTLDIPNNFFTGFHRKGIFEMRPWQIAQRYMRKLFLVDLSIVLVDWVVILNDHSLRDSFGFVRIVKSYRMARALRMIRVVRIAKMLNVVVQLSDHVSFFQSDTIKIVSDIVKAVLLIMVASHFLACGWYAIGSSMTIDDPDKPLDRWVEKFIEDQGGDPSLGYQYLTALHWALTQFTPASMEVVPRNVVERIYAVIVLLLAVVTFSSFVSSVTSSMTRLRMMNMDRSKQKEAIRRFIVDHHMTLGVGNRIHHFLRKQDTLPHARVHEKDVVLFKSLPEALRVDMHREVFLPVIWIHPFFHHYIEYHDDASLATICHTAMQEKAAARGEYLFNWGETATHMYFVQTGSCEYYFGATHHTDISTVGPEGVVSEAVLWVPWLHVGRLLAVKHVELAILDSVTLQGVMRGQPAAKAARAYALQFLGRRLNTEGETPTDLCTEVDEALEMAQLAWAHVERSDNGSSGLVKETSRRMNRMRGFANNMRHSIMQITGLG